MVYRLSGCAVFLTIDARCPARYQPFSIFAVRPLAARPGRGHTWSADGQPEDEHPARAQCDDDDDDNDDIANDRCARVLKRPADSLPRQEEVKKKSLFIFGTPELTVVWTAYHGRRQRSNGQQITRRTRELQIRVTDDSANGFNRRSSNENGSKCYPTVPVWPNPRGGRVRGARV